MEAQRRDGTSPFVLETQLAVKQGEKVIPLNCHRGHIRKEPTVLHPEPLPSHFAHHPDRLSILVPRPSSLGKEHMRRVWEGRESTATAARERGCRQKRSSKEEM